MQSQEPLEMSIKLPCIVRYESESQTFVSECPPLNLVSAAETEDEAVAAIQSAVVLYLQTVLEDQRFGEVLKEKGFRFTNDPGEIMMAEHYIAVRVDERAKAVSVKVPIGRLVANQMVAS